MLPRDCKRVTGNSKYETEDSKSLVGDFKPLTGHFELGEISGNNQKDQRIRRQKETVMMKMRQVNLITNPWEGRKYWMRN